jgi:phosphoenolpyruvate carboxylase
MPDVPSFKPTAALAQELLDLIARVGARADEDPFGNPVLLVSLAITRQWTTAT